MPPSLRLNAVAFISPQNSPILIRAFLKEDRENAIKFHYIAHTSVDVIEERVNTAGKSTDCYLGFLYAMEDVAIYGYITPLKVKIVLALALTDAVVKDADVITIFKALHIAYYSAISNPFLQLSGTVSDFSPFRFVGNPRWRTFRQHVDEISQMVNNNQS